MNRTPQITGLLFAVLLTMATACSKRDKVINVAADDAEMTAAISKARETLPQFWQVFDKRERGESDFALKVRITDNKGSEHFWTTDIARLDGRLMGTINNDPNTVATVKLGQRVDVPEADITDWLYMREGRMIGNHTLKPLFKQMPAEEVARLRTMMADP